ncbi:MAG: hypothetical protein LIO78_00020 [Clostridiales bacterium]|nr:hypothetical protein [Clostridiales bacterium]
MDSRTYDEYWHTYKRIADMPRSSERTKMAEDMIDMLRINFGPRDEEADKLIRWLDRL